MAEGRGTAKSSSCNGGQEVAGHSPSPPAYRMVLVTSWVVLHLVNLLWQTYTCLPGTSQYNQGGKKSSCKPHLGAQYPGVFGGCYPEWHRSRT